MRISIIGPATQIPPIGWGAVESLIWDYKLSLEELGYEVQIINIINPSEIIQRVNQFRPDFVHINYDDWIVLYPYIQYPCAITSHFGYIERQDMLNGYVNIFRLFQDYKPNIFCLSNNIKKVYKFFAEIPEEKLYINPNGVNSSLFKKTDEPKYPDRSIYLAKVDYRKRQHLIPIY
jgi:glycosyltransferase involved in cell wall biosynthesis